MNKPLKLTLMVAGALGASATAFLLYKKYKEVKDEIAEEESLRKQVEEVLRADTDLKEMERSVARATEAVNEAIEKRVEVDYPEYTYDAKEAKALRTHDEVPTDKYIKTEDLPEHLRGSHVVDLMDSKFDRVNILGGADVMKYDKNSVEAMNQYKQFKLAGYEDELTFRIMMKLFEHPWESAKPQDVNIPLNVHDARAAFFGETSIWVDNVTVADVLLYLAEKLSWNMDTQEDEVCTMFLTNLGIYSPGLTNANYIDAVEDFITDDLMGEVDGFTTNGIFGLTDDEMSDLGEGLYEQLQDYMSKESGY